MARALRSLASVELPGFLPRQRWFGSKGRPISSVVLVDCGPLGESPCGPWLMLVEVSFAVGPRELYAVPLAIRADALPAGRLVGRVEVQGTPWLAYDAFDDGEACLALLARVARDEVLPTEMGRVRFRRTAAFPSLRTAPSLPVRRVTSEQSNTSVIYDESLILKAFRKVEPGLNPDQEVAEFLTVRTAFRHVPLLAGVVDYSGPRGLEASLGMLQHFVPNQGDGWTFTLDHLKRLYEFVGGHPDAIGREPGRVAEWVREFSAGFFETARRLGARTGGLHGALASDPTDPAFAPEPISDEDVHTWAAALIHQVVITLDTLRDRIGILPEALRREAEVILGRQIDLAERARDLRVLARDRCMKTRIHGDYHLGQTLRTQEDFVILDFEGEPARSLAGRRAKYSPLRDVAGMLRSFDYAVAAAFPEGSETQRPEAGALAVCGDVWARTAAETFLAGYEAEVARAPARLVPASPEAMAAALAVYELDKALYELRYEIDNRPAWLRIPLRGLTRILARRPGEDLITAPA